MLLASKLGPDQEADQKSADASAEEGLVRSEPALKAGVLAHGTMVEKSDFEKVESPVGIVAVEGDGLFPDEVREEGVKSLKNKGVDVESWVYPGVPHGESIRIVLIGVFALTTYQVLPCWVITRT